MVQDGDNLRFYDCEQGNELVFGDYELHLLVADEYDDEYDTDTDVDSSQPTTDLLCQPLASEPVDEDESLRSLLVQRRSHLLCLISTMVYVPLFQLQIRLLRKFLLTTFFLKKRILFMTIPLLRNLFLLLLMIPVLASLCQSNTGIN